uniref:RNA helicase n=1 Tax=Noctiluca scintillans TaxID=2966 RepID=A0A7S1F7C8_NOCSC|mmetsp:Transcript_40399/g.107127  ORF Transcript_40399/g.107127 Transcript_40399/m.107127 type:complete len:541 (+) Transcript_40399:33-1655(+)
MDFFDVLRKGCTFGPTSSKSVHFRQATKKDVTEKSTGRPRLDFFGQVPKIKETKQDDFEKDLQKDSSQRPKKKRKTEAGTQDVTTPVRKEDYGALRKKYRIHTSADAPDLMVTFDKMEEGMPPWLVAALRGLGFSQPTAIQMQCIPAVLAGNNLLASAPTGSGKTIAFLAPLVARLGKPAKLFARVLVVDPTRELAKQTLDEFVRLTHRTRRKWCGNMLDRVTSERAKTMAVDVAITTPSRLLMLLKNKWVTLEATRHLVLDEADKLLDLGFAPQVDEILSFLPGDVQTLLFSATLPQGVCELAKSILASPLRITIGEVNAAAPDVKQRLLFITRDDMKLSSFRQLVQNGEVKPPTLIFVQSKERAKQLFSELVYDGICVDVIHADRTRTERDNVITAFRAGKIWMLICTDLMARGVDFKDVETVINFDFPQSASTYIHRIGRTGRAGRAGVAITMFTIEDFESLRSIVNVMRQSGCEVPEWTLRLRTKSKRLKRIAEYRPPVRKPIASRAKPLKKKPRLRQRTRKNNQRLQAGTLGSST